MRSGGRVVEGARLESEYTAKPYRGFESLPLRHMQPIRRTISSRQSIENTSFYCFRKRSFRLRSKLVSERPDHARLAITRSKIAVAARSEAGVAVRSNRAAIAWRWISRKAAWRRKAASRATARS